MEKLKHHAEYLLKIILVCLSCFIAYDLISTNFLKLPTFIMVLIAVVFAFIVSFALNRPVGIFGIFRKKTDKEKLVEIARALHIDEKENFDYVNKDRRTFADVDRPVSTTITASPAPRNDSLIVKSIGHIINAIGCNVLLLITIILITR